MNILVTGGTTFVSRYTAECFIKRGDEVYVLNRGTREQPEGAKTLCCDRTALGSALRGAHFDAILDVTAYTGEHVKKLLDSGVEFGDYVLISSSAVYPETNAQPFSEDQTCGRNSVWGDYGTNKLDAEKELLSRVSGAYILRPPYFYGIYENLYREAFPFDCAMEDRPFYIPRDGSMKLQFFNVRDLCRFIEILLEQHPADNIYNVGSPETVTAAQWAELCYKAAGKTPTLISMPASVPQREYFPFHDYEYVLDVTKQSALMPDLTPLEDGLCEEFLWYSSHPESVYYRKPYLENIEKRVEELEMILIRNA